MCDHCTQPDARFINYYDSCWGHAVQIAVSKFRLNNVTKNMWESAGYIVNLISVDHFWELCN